MPGAFVLALGTLKANDRITAAFRSGDGMGWHEHDEDVFTGCEQFFRPGYVANLVPSWLPALDGVVEKLRAGAKGADLGCGLGASTVLLARRTRNQALSGRTTTSARSSWPASARPTRASPTGCSSRWPRRPGSPDRTTT